VRAGEVPASGVDVQGAVGTREHGGDGQCRHQPAAGVRPCPEQVVALDLVLDHTVLDAVDTQRQQLSHVVLVVGVCADRQVATTCFVDDGAHDLAGQLVQRDAVRTVQSALVDQLDQVGTLAVQVPDRRPGAGSVVDGQG